VIAQKFALQDSGGWIPSGLYDCQWENFLMLFDNEFMWIVQDSR